MTRLLATSIAAAAVLAAGVVVLADDHEDAPATQAGTQPATQQGGDDTTGGATVVDGVSFTTTRSGEGFGERVAKDGDLLMVHYTGKLDDGTVFDSSLNARPGSRKPYGVPLMLKLGRGEVIKGWEIGLQGMQVGERRTIVIPPELAYGDRDLGVIPPNSTLTFDVELVGLYREE